MLKLYCRLLAVNLCLASSKQEKKWQRFSRKDTFIVECPKDEDVGDIKPKDLKELTCQYGEIRTLARDVGLVEELDL